MSHILLVDDNAELLMIQRKILSRAGHVIETATDGAQALAAAEARVFDLVITDIIMPGKEGIETILALRRRQPDLKIIAMSGGGRIGAGDYLEVARKLGASRALAKPFSDVELLEAVQAVLARG